MSPTEILALWQAARAANSTTGKALALSLAEENARDARKALTVPAALAIATKERTNGRT